MNAPLVAPQGVKASPAWETDLITWSTVITPALHNSTYSRHGHAMMMTQLAELLVFLYILNITNLANLTDL